MIIFDCNGVLVDSERIAAAVAAEEFTRIGIALTPELVARFFFGRRPADMIAMVETAGRCKLPASFPSRLAGATLNRLRAKVVGLVLNEVHKEMSESYYYYGYYRSYYAAKEEVPT